MFGSEVPGWFEFRRTLTVTTDAIDGGQIRVTVTDPASGVYYGADCDTEMRRTAEATLYQQHRADFERRLTHAITH